MQVRKLPGFAELAHGSRNRHPGLVHLAESVRVLQLRHELESPLAPGSRLLESEVLERSVATDSERERAQLGIADPLDEVREGLQLLVGRISGQRMRPRQQSTGLRRAALFGELQRTFDPCLDPASLRPNEPHSGANRRLKREQAVCLGTLASVEWAFERALHGCPEGLAVVPQRLCLTRRPPQERTLVLVVGELDRPCVQLDRLVHLVPATSKVGGAP